MPIPSPNGDHDDGWTWLNCVGWATAVQVVLIILCFIVRNVESMALILVLLYLPGYIAVAGADSGSFHMSAWAVWLLLLFSIAFYSVLFGTLFYSCHQYILMLRSFGESRPHKPLSEPESETRDEQGKTDITIATPEELADIAAEESVEVQNDAAEISAESEPAADLPKDRGMLWLRCVIVVTAVQPFLLLVILVAPDSILAAGVMTYFYIPARLLVDGFNLPGPVVLILFLLSVVSFSVFFGTVVYFGYPLVKRMPQRASAFKRRVRDRQSKRCSNSEYDGGVKWGWGCCVSVLILLQFPLALYCIFGHNGGMDMEPLYKQYVYNPAEWLLTVSCYSCENWNLLPFLLFLLLAAGTFYSVLFGSLFYWLCRESHRLFKFLSRKAAGGS